MESVLYIDCWMINPIIIKKVKSQVILPHWVDSKKLYNKKTEKLLR